MLHLNKDTEFTDVESEMIISDTLKKMTDLTNELSKVTRKAKVNYIVISEQIAKEINKLQWNKN